MGLGRGCISWRTLFKLLQLVLSEAVWIYFLFPKSESGFPGGSDSKESACNAKDPGSIPRSGRSPGEGNGYRLHYSCLENSMDRGAWRAIIHGVAKRHDWVTSTFIIKSESNSRKTNIRNLPGGPASKTLCFQCKRPRFHPWLRN